MEDLKTKTSELKVLIQSTKKSAKDAWRAGELLSSIRDRQEYKGAYSSFDEYTKREFGVSSETANKYIDLYKKVDYHLLSDNMLVTHLYLLLETDEKTRSELLRLMNYFEQTDDASSQSYDADVVRAVIQLLQSAKRHFSRGEVMQLWRDISTWKKEVVNKRSTPRHVPFRMGSSLRSAHFPEVEKLFDSEPVDEQGLVGLFCAMFHLIRDAEFEYGTDVLRLSKILYIRTPFPDAKLEAVVVGRRQRRTYLDVEFEFESLNYLTHKHDASPNNCQVIVCWENNWPNSQDFNRPLILAVRDLLETGNIDLQ